MFFGLNILWHISQEFASGAGLTGLSSLFWPLVLDDGPATAKAALREDLATAAAA